MGLDCSKEEQVPGKGSGKGWLGGRGGCKGFGCGGVGGRGTGPRDGANFATCVVFLSFLTRTKRRKMAFFEGCPVGWAGKGWLGGERLGGYPPKLAWWTGPELGPRAGLVDGGSGRRGKGSGGGARASVPGG